jgi:hypothetical protein
VTLRQKFTTLRLLHRTGGVRAVLAHTVAVMGYREIFVYELDLDALPAPAQAPPGLAFGWLGESELDELAAHRPAVPRTTWDERIATGDRCWVSREGRRVVSSHWVTLGPTVVTSTGVRCSVPARYGYIHDVFTSADVRGRRIGPAAAAQLATALAAEGVLTLVGFVEAGNHWAVRNAENASWRRTGSLVKLAVGSWNLPVRRTTELDARIEL